MSAVTIHKKLVSIYGKANPEMALSVGNCNVFVYCKCY